MPVHCVWRVFVLHRVLGGPAGPVFCVFVFWAGTTGLCFVFSCFGRPLADPSQNTGQQSARPLPELLPELLFVVAGVCLLDARVRAHVPLESRLGREALAAPLVVAGVWLAWLLARVRAHVLLEFRLGREALAAPLVVAGVWLAWLLARVRAHVLLEARLGREALAAPLVVAGVWLLARVRAHVLLASRLARPGTPIRTPFP